MTRFPGISGLSALALVAAGWLAPAVAQDRASKPLDRVMSPDARNASIDEFPWQVALLRDDGRSNFDAQFCGGSVIAPTWVLTAAHCIEDQTADGIVVLYGTASLEAEGRIANVRRIIPHERYRAGTDGAIENDIALLELESPIPAETVRLAAPEAAWAEAAGGIAIVTGWGEQNPEGPAGDAPAGLAAVQRARFPTELQSAALPIVDNATCAAAYGSQGMPSFDGRVICAGAIGEGVDACNGDSGGPLQVQSSDGRYLQVGLVSWGQTCDTGGFFTVYTRVSAFADWITRTMAGGAPPVRAEGEVAVTATFGRIDLSAGFPGDPVSVAVFAGGDESASRLSSNCSGYIARNPDVSLFYTSGSYPLYIASASAADTTLVVLAPDGRLSCSDDFEGINPAIEIAKPGSGEYRIWIGTYDAGGSDYPKAVLYISELGVSFGG